MLLFIYAQMILWSQQWWNSCKHVRYQSQITQMSKIAQHNTALRYRHPLFSKSRQIVGIAIVGTAVVGIATASLKQHLPAKWVIVLSPVSLRWLDSRHQVTLVVHWIYQLILTGCPCQSFVSPLPKNLKVFHRVNSYWLAHPVNTMTYRNFIDVKNNICSSCTRWLVQCDKSRTKRATKTRELAIHQRVHRCHRQCQPVPFVD